MTIIIYDGSQVTVKKKKRISEKTASGSDADLDLLRHYYSRRSPHTHTWAGTDISPTPGRVLTLAWQHAADIHIRIGRRPSTRNK